jgi:hypothetical protein
MQLLRLLVVLVKLVLAQVLLLLRVTRGAMHQRLRLQSQLLMMRGQTQVLHQWATTHLFKSLNNFL